MKRVILESPYGDPNPEVVTRNVEYARACVRDSLMRGEAPLASHLLYTQPGILRDEEPAERKLGIDAGLSWMVAAEMAVVYADHGVSPGMQQGIERAERYGTVIERRTLQPSSKPPSISLSEKIACLKRELALRRNVYRKRVQDGKMTPNNARHELDVMESILADYEMAPTIIAPSLDDAQRQKIEEQWLKSRDN